jgi:hypothetical protein
MYMEADCPVRKRKGHDVASVSEQQDRERRAPQVRNSAGALRSSFARIVSHDDFVILRKNGDVQEGYTASVKAAGSTNAQDLHVINVTKTARSSLHRRRPAVEGSGNSDGPCLQTAPFADCMNSPAKKKSKTRHCST